MCTNVSSTGKFGVTAWSVAALVHSKYRSVCKRDKWGYGNGNVECFHRKNKTNVGFAKSLFQNPLTKSGWILSSNASF